MLVRLEDHVLEKATLLVSLHISPGLYIFTPFFITVYNQKQWIIETIYVVNKTFFQKNPRFMIKSGFKSREGYNGAYTVHGKARSNQTK